METLVGDDIDIEDIVWYGSVDSVADMAAQVGVAHSAPMKQLQAICDEAKAKGRRIHFLPPYRHDTKIQIMDLLGIHPDKQAEAVSHDLRMAVINMRSVKTAEEIAELERAAEVGYLMHTTAMRLIKPGVTEKYIGGQIDGIAESYGAKVSFATIFSQHGEIMASPCVTAAPRPWSSTAAITRARCLSQANMTSANSRYTASSRSAMTWLSTSPSRA